MWIRALLLTVLLSPCVNAAKFAILTEQWPPMNYQERGVFKGLSVEVVQALQKDLKDTTPIQIMTWRNAYLQATSTPNVLLFSTVKTEMRSKLFTFVGPLAKSSINLYSLKKYPIPIETLEQAKHVKRIGVYYSAVEEQRLIEMGFKNLVSVRTPVKIAHLLLRGRIDLWCNINITYRDILKQLGVSADQVVKKLTIDESPLYLAFSKGTPAETIERWRKALIKLHQSGEFEKIHQKWLPGEEVPGFVEQQGVLKGPTDQVDKN
ncbi:substrate-binding periplasmic protein [Dongshaea marina]|uniref:substrate-binding periplasmic protein n=1 Tax=Dongshaea marina TaxID=2047966 RepID=UPI000D3E7629|nr:ABC transporter substrate-binding protein [Dongshaea marina]